MTQCAEHSKCITTISTNQQKIVNAEKEIALYGKRLNKIENKVSDIENTLSRGKEKLETTTEKIEGVERIVSLIHEMSADVKVLANEMVHNSESMKLLVKSMEKTQEEVDEIKENMETKGTVSRLHGRIDELEKKDGKEAEKQLKQLKWLFISTIAVYVITNVVDRLNLF